MTVTLPFVVMLIGVRAIFSRGAEPSLPENFLTVPEKMLC